MKIIKQIYPAEIVKRNPPCNIEQSDEHLFGGPTYECKLNPTFLVELRNVIVTHDGIILKNLLPQKRFILFYLNDFRKYWKRYVLHVFFKMRRQKIQDDKYLMIFDNYTGPTGLAHWVSDGLTRLIELDPILDGYTVLVPDYFLSAPIFTTTLKFFNIRSVQKIDKNCFVKAKRLFVCDHIANSGDYRPQNISKLRNQIFSKLPESTNHSRRIYISRKKASRRFVRNEEEVEQLMDKFGFRSICMEDHDFEKQIQIAQNAEILVSIHGAALSHILFMKKHTSVLEFRREGDQDNGMFFSLADAIGINYYYLSCKGFLNSNIANNFDLEVDRQKLEETLSLILSHEAIRY